jgi:hypothetical protein
LGETPSRSFIKGNTLYISGLYIDSLKEISFSTGTNLEAILATAREKGRKSATDAKNKYFTGESFANAAQHNCVMDLVYDEQTRPSQRGGKRDAIFLKQPRAELSLAEYRLQMNMRNAVTKASISRNTWLSQRMYLLMVPITAVVGDSIWAIAGGQVLYILRPVSRETNQYRFIGECYAHGLMDGEILRRLQMEKQRWMIYPSYSWPLFFLTIYLCIVSWSLVPIIFTIFHVRSGSSISNNPPRSPKDPGVNDLADEKE